MRLVRDPAQQPLFVPSTPLERRLTGTLWTVRAQAWSGYMDFMAPGHYFTHWGFGTWRSLEERVVRLQNSYDPFWFVFEFDDELMTLTTTSTNHAQSRFVGDFLWDYANQQPPKPAY